MANTPSDVVGDLLASPPVFSPAGSVHAGVHFGKARALLAVGHLTGRIYPLLRLPAHARVISIFTANTGQAAQCEVDLGLYTAGNWLLGDQASFDSDCLYENLDLSDERRGEAVLFLNGSTEVFGRRLFDVVIPPTAPPRSGTLYDLAMTLVDNVTTAGFFELGILYAAGD